MLDVTNKYLTKQQITDVLAWLFIIVVILASLGASAVFGYQLHEYKHPSGKLITETYTVQAGDTVWTIAEMYIAKNTYGPREIREFYHGIIENNYDLFNGRVVGLIKPGDELKINYRVKE